MPGNVLIPELKVTWFLPVAALLPVAAGFVFVVTVLVVTFFVTFFTTTFFVVGVTVLVITMPFGETVRVTTVPFGDTVLVTTAPFGDTVLVATVPDVMVRGITVLTVGFTSVGFINVG